MFRSAALSSLALFGLIFPAGAKQPVHARHAIVVAEEPIATDVGVATLKAGGNAIDAAVALGFALAVTYPYAGNLGGGGFLLVRMADGKSSFIDFREAAPAAASRNMYLDASGNLTQDSVLGWRAAGVPGTVRGLEMAHRKFGHTSWNQLLEPAVKLAHDGFTVSYAVSQQMEQAKSTLEQFPESKRIFLNGGAGWQMGGHFSQPELARVLERIAKEGPRDFYEGETAKLIADAMSANGGLITLDDLKNYKAVERKPIIGKYKGLEIISSPPPSSGGIGLLQMLGILEGTDYAKSGFGAAATIHYEAEAMRRWYADRSELMGDPDFVKIPMRGLLDPAYIAKQRASIDPNHATPSSDIHAGKFAPNESSETTHFSIVDADGNAVSMTYTLNGGFGNKVTVPGAGFLLNNEMDDFAAKPGSENMFHFIQGEANAIQPGKRPVSSMTPTIVVREGKPYIVVGGPGGTRITSAVMQVILNVVDFGMNAQDAVDAPRLHHQWMPDEISMERGFSPDTVKILQGMGHQVRVSNAVARVEAIVLDGGWLMGGADGRADTKAAGY
jgi:gamma-glutamyltranspeptidase / glutathione hydrolase